MKKNKNESIKNRMKNNTNIQPNKKKKKIILKIKKNKIIVKDILKNYINKKKKNIKKNNFKVLNHKIRFLNLHIINKKKDIKNNIKNNLAKLNLNTLLFLMFNHNNGFKSNAIINSMVDFNNNISNLKANEICSLKNYIKIYSTFYIQKIKYIKKNPNIITLYKKFGQEKIIKSLKKKKQSNISINISCLIYDIKVLQNIKKYKKMLEKQKKNKYLVNKLVNLNTLMILLKKRLFDNYLALSILLFKKKNIIVPKALKLIKRELKQLKNKKKKYYFYNKNEKKKTNKYKTKIKSIFNILKKNIYNHNVLSSFIKVAQKINSNILNQATKTNYYYKNTKTSFYNVIKRLLIIQKIVTKKEHNVMHKQENKNNRIELNKQNKALIVKTLFLENQKQKVKEELIVKLLLNIIKGSLLHATIFDFKSKEEMQLTNYIKGMYNKILVNIEKQEKNIQKDDLTNYLKKIRYKALVRYRNVLLSVKKKIKKKIKKQKKLRRRFYKKKKGKRFKYKGKSIKKQLKTIKIIKKKLKKIKRKNIKESITTYITENNKVFKLRLPKIKLKYKSQKQLYISLKRKYKLNLYTYGIRGKQIKKIQVKRKFKKERIPEVGVVSLKCGKRNMFIVLRDRITNIVKKVTTSKMVYYNAYGAKEKESDKRKNIKQKKVNNKETKKAELKYKGKIGKYIVMPHFRNRVLLEFLLKLNARYNYKMIDMEFDTKKDKVVLRDFFSKKWFIYKGIIRNVIITRQKAHGMMRLKKARRI